jgi:phosphoribosylamine--glycine ligase
MKILVIGGGGREHALVWKLKQSGRVEKIWCAPGNGGISADSECVSIDAGDVSGLVAFADKNLPDVTVVGPELPLVDGIGDAFRQRGWGIVGPSKLAAELEGSKIFAKEFLERHNIPTAKMYGSFTSDFAEARDFIERVMEKKELGAGGRRILLEERLEGDELSLILVTDGRSYAPLVPTRDHKRVFDGNQGPNTGGMGAYSTDALLPDGLRTTIVSTIVEPTLAGLAAQRIPYQGFLYIGLMLAPSGPKVLEFNCRLGDPETQAIVARMDFDLAEVLEDVASGRLIGSKLHWKPGASACVVLASGGYPGKFETGKPVDGLASAEQIAGVKVLHAGTKRVGNDIVTSGGRVLGVTSWGPNLATALGSAYAAAERIRFDRMHYRKDIGQPGHSLKASGN